MPFLDIVLALLLDHFDTDAYWMRDGRQASDAAGSLAAHMESLAHAGPSKIVSHRPPLQLRPLPTTQLHLDLQNRYADIDVHWQHIRDCLATQAAL